MTSNPASSSTSSEMHYNQHGVAAAGGDGDLSTNDAWYSCRATRHMDGALRHAVVRRAREGTKQIHHPQGHEQRPRSRCTSDALRDETRRLVGARCFFTTRVFFFPVPVRDISSSRRVRPFARVSSRDRPGTHPSRHHMSTRSDSVARKRPSVRSNAATNSVMFETVTFTRTSGGACGSVAMCFVASCAVMDCRHTVAH